MEIKPISLDLATRLTSRRFRERFLSTLARDEIAAQIRQLRIKRGFVTQSAFAKETGMQQSAVSRIEQADYSGWTFRTLLKVAFALKARLRVTFEPIETVIETAKKSEQAAELQLETDNDLATLGADVDDFNTETRDVFHHNVPWPKMSDVNNNTQQPQVSQ